jgi:hypothetical protein
VVPQESHPVRAWGSGKVIGRITEEGQVRVFERNVSERHWFYSEDCWSLGSFALVQLRQHRCDLVRYRQRGVGQWEIGFREFLRFGQERSFSNLGEKQFLVSRAYWRFTPEPPLHQQQSLTLAGV